jgi:hypothetical protein
MIFVLYLKGSKGFYSTFQGLNLIYLSGYEGASSVTDSSSSKKQKTSDEDKSCLVEFTSEDVESIINNCETRHPGECIDLLLTSQWPKFVENLSKQELVS